MWGYPTQLYASFLPTAQLWPKSPKEFNHPTKLIAKLERERGGDKTRQFKTIQCKRREHKMCKK